MAAVTTPPSCITLRGTKVTIQGAPTRDIHWLRPFTVDTPACLPRIHVGDDEVLDDSLRYVEEAIAAGVDATWVSRKHRTNSHQSRPRVLSNQVTVFVK
jgi:hypothetical protein